MHRPVAILFAAEFAVRASPPSPDAVQAPSEAPKEWVYAGKPLVVAPGCRPDDLGALGLTCTADEPCPILLELAAVETVGARILAIGNLHTTSITLESVLLASEDGGRTWTEAHARLPATAFDQIQFIDFENGWISGQAITTLPRDPFFLISSNGGKSWRRRPVFSEPRVGLVEGFWFTSKNQGAMAIDRLQSAENGLRYELYNSLTGGDSWMLQQLSEKPIALKRPPKSESELRLRADAAAQAYKVERRAAEKWQTLAMFAISSGDCRAPEANLGEPPAEPLQPAPEPPKTGKKKR